MTQSIIQFLVRSNLWVAICFAFYIYQTNILLEVDDSNLVLFCFFSTLFTYNAQRIYKFRKSKIISPFNSWIGENMLTLIVLSIIGGVGILYTSAYLDRKDIFILSFPFLFSIFYVVDIPFLKRKINLRELPLAKIFVIAISWTILVVFLPLNRRHLNISNFETITLILEKFFFILAITIPFDIRDAAYDAPEIKTIPQVVGFKRAYLFSYIFLILSFLLMTLQGYSGIGDFLIWNILSYALVTALIYYSRISEYPDFHGFYLDGIFLFQTLILMLGIFLESVLN